MAGGNSLAKLREVHAANKAEWYSRRQKDITRTFGKIRRHAQAIVDLLADQDTRLCLTSLLIEDGMNHEEAKQFIENLHLLAAPPLSRLFDRPPPVPRVHPGSINDLREVFFIMLFKHHWNGPPRPTGSQFVEFCSEQLALANDRLEISVVERILKAIPRDRFFY